MNNFIKMDDYLLVNTYMGRNKHLKLTRTYYEFVSSDYQKSHPGAIPSNVIILPNITQKFHYILELIDDRYVFYAKDNTHFNINGSYSYRSIITQLDKIRIEYNIVSFTNKPESNPQSIVPTSIINMSDDVTILLIGETGTGKSSYAKKLHQMSNKLGSFVQVNLASFAPTLIESELFGYVKGAFTGAHQDKKGAFLEANEGTLFLDEIDSLPIEMQVKLLLFFDNYSIRPVGGNQEKSVKTSIIIASGTPLEKLLLENRMRQDFYYRITSGLKIELKPLRADTKKIEQICEEFSIRENIFISANLMEFYKKQKWPGNIRQLINHLKKKKILSAPNRKLEFDSTDNELTYQSFTSSSTYLLNNNLRSLEELKKDYIQNVYHQCQGNHHDCIKILDISYNTFKKYVTV